MELPDRFAGCDARRSLSFPYRSGLRNSEQGPSVRVRLYRYLFLFFPGLSPSLGIYLTDPYRFHSAGTGFIKQLS